MALAANGAIRQMRMIHNPKTHSLVDTVAIWSKRKPKERLVTLPTVNPLQRTDWQRLCQYVISHMKAQRSTKCLEKSP